MKTVNTFLVLIISILLTVSIVLAIGTGALSIGGDRHGYKGQKIPVYINANNIEGIGNITIEFTYDGSVIQTNLGDITAGDLTKNFIRFGRDVNNNIGNNIGKVTLNILNDKEISGNGSLANVTFLVVGSKEQKSILNMSVTDTNGGPINVAVTNSTFSVTDAPPTIIAPKDITANATGPKTLVYLGTPSVSDPDGDLINVSNDAPLDGFDVGNKIVTWTASDGMLTSSATQLVTIIDRTPPNLTIPPNKTVNATGNLTRVDIGNATVTDIVDPGPIIPTNNAPPGLLFPIGITNVTWTATNKYNLTSPPGIQLVTVNATSPNLAVPPDITTMATGNLTRVDVGNATATDIVDPGPIIPTNNAPPDLLFPIGITNVTWKATNKFNLSTTANQTITILGDSGISLSVDNSTKTVNSNQNATYNITINNTGTVEDTFNFTVNNSNNASIVKLIISPIPIGDCTDISLPGNYTISNDIINSSSDCIRITSSNVILDGVGHTISGQNLNTSGVLVNTNSEMTLTNVIVKNLILTNWTWGISYQNVSNGIIADNIVINSDHGIIMNYSSGNNTMINNILSYNTFGIKLNHADNNFIIDNTINSNNKTGILIEQSNYTSIGNNNLDLNNESGMTIQNSSNNIITGNSVSYTLAEDSNGILMNGSNGNIISNNNLSNNAGTGISVISAKDNTLSRNVLNINMAGIFISDCHNNTITGNDARFDINTGISIGSCNNNDINNNNVMSGDWIGIMLIDTSSNNVTNNTVKYNNLSGIRVNNGTSNILVNNIANNNNYSGIDLIFRSNNNILRGNIVISNSNYGININSSNNNTIYNNYFNNTNNVLDRDNNTWNTTKRNGTNIVGGLSIGGNFWSDYIGNDTDNDGIGDTLIPYNSSGNITNHANFQSGDYLPLMFNNNTDITKTMANITNISMTNNSNIIIPNINIPDIFNIDVSNISLSPKENKTMRLIVADSRPGIYAIYVKTASIKNQSKNATITTVTTILSPPPASTPTRSSSSGGGSSIGGGGPTGGGGGVTTTEPFDNIFKTETREKSLVTNVTVTYVYTSPKLIIYEADVLGLVNEDNIALRIEVLKDRSKFLEAVNGKVYKYINAKIGSSKIKKVTFKYEVDNSWIDDNRILRESIKLFRYDRGWIGLVTKITGQDGNYTYYESYTDGLSYFAISGSEIPIPTPTVASTPALIVTKSTVQTPVIPKTPNESTTVTPPKRGIPGVGIGLSMIVLIVIYARIKRKI